MPTKKLEDLLAVDDTNREELVNVIEQVSVDSVQDADLVKSSFNKVKSAFLKMNEDLAEILDAVDSQQREIREKDDELEFARRQLARYQEDPNRMGTKEALDFERIERQNDELLQEKKEAEEKYYIEKSANDKLRTTIEEQEKRISTMRRDLQRYEEELREHERNRERMWNEKYNAGGPEIDRLKRQLNDKLKLIDEYERATEKLTMNNQELENKIRQAESSVRQITNETEKTTYEYQKIRDQLNQNDARMVEMQKENEQLRFQLQNYREQMANKVTSDVNSLDKFAQEYELKLKNKDEDIRKLTELVLELKANLNMKLKSAEIDSDKNTVSALKKTLQERDKQILGLKQQIDECRKEIDKSTTTINNLNKSYYENSKLFSKSNQYNLNKQAEQKIAYLEKTLQQSESRVKDYEDQLETKEKELVEASNRLRDYVSGDYQLQDALNEIKECKSQIKVRDRDIENLIKQLNQADLLLNQALEENDDYRAKLGLKPKDKINIEEVNHLRAIRAQENRAMSYVLQRENEELQAKNNRLHSLVAKMAKQIRSREVVAQIFSEEGGLGDLTYLNEFIESKGGKKHPTNTADESGKDPKRPNTESSGSSVDGEKLKKDNGMLRKKNEHMMQILLNFENQNRLLGEGLREIQEEIKSLNTVPTGSQKMKARGKENIIKCPSLDKLLAEYENLRSIHTNMKSYSFVSQMISQNASGLDGIALELKSELDFVLGRNEELRGQVVQLNRQLCHAQTEANKWQEESEKLKGDVRYMNNSSSAKDIFHPFKLPPGMSPSSQDIISALNEYLVDTLQELEEYRKLCTRAENELTVLRRKYAVSRHQMGLLYKDHIEKTKEWQGEKDKLDGMIRKLNDMIAVDAVKLQEYDQLLDSLQHCEPIIRQRLAESSRQMAVLRANEKQLARKCDALNEVKEVIVRENKKLRVDIIEMEMAVQQRIGYLERYKDMANFRIASLQHQLEDSVPLSKLEHVNKEYTEVVGKYRQLLDRQEHNDQLVQTLNMTEELNKNYERDIQGLKIELETSKDRVNVLEEMLNRMKSFSIIVANGSNNGQQKQNDMYKYQEYEARGTYEPDHDVMSMAKRLTAIEMKELNERQRADHAQRMYDQQRNILRELENRNLELEHNFKELTNKYLGLERSEQYLKDQLTQYVSKEINDRDKERIKQLEKQENFLKLEVSRLRELTEITLYQTQSLDFINKMSKTHLELFNLINLQTSVYEDDETFKLGKLHRQLILMQLSEATAVHKLQNAENKNKRLEAQLIRTEQKSDKENLDFYFARKEYISKITYLRAIVQDLRHKYTGAIPLKQQERFVEAKEQVASMKKELSAKLLKLNEEKNELEDRIAEYNARIKEIEMLKSAAIIGKDGTVRFNEKFLDSFKKTENLKMLNLKLERANKRYKDEIKFLEEMNRKLEIAIIAQEEENLRLESEFDQRLNIWEHREADLERTIEHLKKQHRIIENLAISFEEISGNMPDASLPVANQLEQAMNIIRANLKLLAEAKLQADLNKKRVEDAEGRVRKLEGEINLRDKIIADLRLRLPVSSDRDLLIHTSIVTTTETSETITPVRAAQATIESLQNRLKQKDETLAKYQDMLKLARDEIANLNKQHELEILGLLDKLNLTRDTNIQKLKQELRSISIYDEVNITRTQLTRLQELEEITLEHENKIGALNQKIKKLTTESETWKAKYEMALQKGQQEDENKLKDNREMVNKLNQQIEIYKKQITEQEDRLNELLNQLGDPKSPLPSGRTGLNSIIENLKKQLAEKEEQQRLLNQALLDLRGDLMNLAKGQLTDPNEKKWQDMFEKMSGEYQDKLLAMSEEMNKLKKELKDRSKTSEEYRLEIEHFKSTIRIRDQRIKKLADENQKLIDDAKLSAANRAGNSHNLDNLELVNLRKKVKTLEEQLKKERLNRAEKPYMDRSKSPKKVTESSETQLLIRTIESDPNNYHSLKHQLEEWKTRYNFQLSENAVLQRQKHDLEIEVERLRREIDINSVQVFNENRVLRDELEKLKSTRSSRNYSPGSPLRAENRQQVSSELQKIRVENEKLKERVRRVEELERMVEYYSSRKSGADEDAQSTTSSNTSIRRLGESGKSNRDLEKTIALMKKVIVKLQDENQVLKRAASSGIK